MLPKGFIAFPKIFVIILSAAVRNAHIVPKMEIWVNKKNVL